MSSLPGRAPELVVIASPHAEQAQRFADELRREGMVVYITRTADGCLRVATAAGPDAVWLDPDLPPRLEQLLRAHPISAAARITWLPATTSHAGARSLNARHSRPAAQHLIGPLRAALTRAPPRAPPGPA